jgi:gliding motility-associated-like protein
VHSHFLYPVKLKNLAYPIILLLILLSGLSVQAGHIAGGNIRYECIGGQQYKVTLTIFRDCSESTVTGTQNIKLRSDCGQLFSVNANLVYTNEVSQLCPTALANSTCSGGIWPGIEVYKYEAIVNLVPDCDSWEIYWELCARSVTVNVDNTAFPCYRIRAILNSATAPCNNSPFVTEEYIPYVCVGQQVNFNPAVNEIDGDSLSFQLVSGLNVGGVPIQYEPGFSGPIPVPGISLNQFTGQLTFTPPTTGTYTIVIAVNEYNSSGQLIGTITHDIIFVVENCPQPVPQPNVSGFTNFQGSGSLNGPNVIAVCGGDSFCADISFSSGNPASIITLSSQIENILPGSSFSYSGTNPVVGTVCWTVPAGFSSAYQINVTAQDNACPVYGVANWGFVITPTIGVYGGPNVVMCPGESTQLNATGDTGYLWQVFSGEPINLGTNFSCIDCPNPIASPSITTTYLVTGLNPTTACINTDTVVVAIALQDLNVITTSETCFLNDAAIVLEVLYGSGNYTYLWEGGETTSSLINIPAGDYDVFIEDLTLGCSNNATVSIDYPPFPDTNAGVDTIVCGLSLDLEAIPSYGSGLWYADPNAIATFLPDPFIPNPTVYVFGPGTWYLTWREDGGNNCIREDSILVTFTNVPTMDAGPTDSICGLSYDLQGNFYIGGGEWTGPPGAVFDPDPFTYNATVTVPTYGTHEFYWSIDIGSSCVDSDTVQITFLTPLVADVGMPFDTVCTTGAPFQYQLQGNVVGTNQYWYSNSPLPIFLPDNTLPDAVAEVPNTLSYNFIWVVEDNYCIDRDTIRVNFRVQPTAVAGPDQIVCSLDANLTVNNSIGIGTWTGPPGATFAPNINTNNVVVTAPGYGVYDFIFTRENAVCTATDTTQVTFTEQPVADAGPDDTICGLSYVLQANPSVGTGTWTGPPSAVFSDVNDPNAIVTMPNQGTFTFTWTEVNGTCSNANAVQIIFYSIPTPEAGLADEICDLTYALQGVSSFGVSTWTGPVGSVFTPNASDVNASVTAPSYGFHQFVLTQDNNGCVVSDSVIIHFKEQPIADAGLGGSTCSLQFDAVAVPSVGVGTWTLPVGYTANPGIASAVTQITAPSYGQATFTWEENNLGCVDAEDIIVDFVEQPSADAGVDDVVCGLVYNLQGNVGVGSGLWTGPAGAVYDPDATTALAITTVAGFGTETFTWTLDNGFGCVDSDEVEITFNPSPPTFAGNDTVVCGNVIDLNATLNASFGSWAAPVDISFSPNENDPSATATSAAFGTYILTWTIDEGNFCTASDDISVTFVEQPVADAGLDQSVCDLTAQLDAIPSVGSGTWYSLIGPVFTPDANAANASVTFINPGIYELWWIENNGFGCMDSASVNVTLTIQPVADAGADQSVCGLSTFLSAAPSAGTGTWSSPNSEISIIDVNDPLTEITASTYGTFIITWTEDNGFGCVSSDVVEISFNENPIANAGTDVTVCGNSADLNAIPTAGTGNWTLPVGISTSDLLSDAQITITASSFGTFILEWSENNGSCISTDLVEITFIANPVSDAGGDINVCGLNTNLSASASVGSGSWLAPAGIFFTPDNFDPAAQITATAYGSYTFTWTEDNGFGCTSSDDVTVVFSEPPIADAGVDDVICGLDYDLNATISSGTGSWSAPAGLIFTPDEFTPNATVAATAYGVYTLTWSEDNVGCTDIATVDITFIETPLTNAGLDDAVCGFDYTLQAIPSSGLGTWSGPAEIAFDNINNPNANITASSVGTYVLTWVEDTGDCSSTDEVTISFVTEPVANAGPDEAVCGLSFTLQASSNVPNGQWLPVAGLSFSNVNDLNATVTASAYGIYTLIWQATAGATCQDQDEVQIEFIEAPVADAGLDDEICDLTYTLNAIPSGGDGTWSGPAEIVFVDDTDPQTQITASTYGVYTLTWTEATGFGCSTSDAVEIAFTENPIAQVGADDIVCGTTYSLSATPSVGVGLWTSSPAGAVFTPNANDPNAEVSIAVPGVYAFTWTETNGNCSASEVVQITFVDQPAADAGPDASVCGLSYGLSANGAAGLWTGPAGVVFNPSANNPNAIAIVPSQGNYMFTWTLDNGNCSSSDEVSVTYFGSPIISGLVANCIDGNINYEVSFTISGGDPTSYSVTGGSGNLVGDVFTSDPIQNGFSYNYQVQDANGCQVVNVSGSFVCPNLTYAGTMNQVPIVICGNNSANAIFNNNQTLDGNDALGFILHSNPGIPLGTVYAQNSVPSFGFQAGMVYGVTYYISSVVGNDDGSGAVDLSDILLSVSEGTPVVFNQTPTAIISGGGTACIGETLFATVDFTGIAPFNFTYSINGNIQAPISTANNSIQIPLTSTSQVIITSISDSFCPGQSGGIVNVSFTPIPTAQISGGGEVCEGESEQILVNLNGSSPFEFVYAIDGNVQAPVITALSQYSFGAVTEGVYSLVSVEDQVCAGQTAGEAEMIVHPYPVANAGPDQEICYGADLAQLGVGAEPGMTYQWTNGQYLSDANSATPTVVYNEPLFVPVPLSFSVLVDNNGCVSTDEVNVILSPVPQIQASGSVNICEGGAAQVSVFGASEVQWSPTTFITDANGFNPWVYPPTDTNYSVSTSNEYGCTAVDTIEVIVQSMPEVQFTSNSTITCAPASILFQNQTIMDGPGYTCIWNFGNGNLVYSCNDVTASYLNNGTYNVSLTVTSPYGCIADYVAYDYINTVGPEASFSYLPNPADVQNSVIQFSNQSSGANTFIWDMAGLESFYTENPLYEFPNQEPGEYEVCLTAISDQGCLDEYCTEVIIKPDLTLYVPNAFSPNGDGINDLFFPVIDGVDELYYEMSIFNRRGKMVWSSVDFNDKWDGGDLTDEYYDDNQIYTWVIRIKDEASVLKSEYTGHVMVVR